MLRIYDRGNLPSNTILTGEIVIRIIINTVLLLKWGFIQLFMDPWS
jgi:hypothetical protein